MKYTPFTYRIGWTGKNKYYYGVRYATKSCCIYSTGCHPDDLWNTYFTSSPEVHQYRMDHGEPDLIEIRKVFKDADAARKWESQVLIRLKAKGNSAYLNKHESPSPPRMTGIDNPAKRVDVREKLSRSAKERTYASSDLGVLKSKNVRNRNYLIRYFLSGKHHKFKPNKSKGTIALLKKRKAILVNHPHPFTRAIAWLDARIFECENYISKPYPTNRKGSVWNKGKKCPNISISKRGKKWYNNPITKETRPFYPSDRPEGWVEGMIKHTPNNMTREVKNKISSSNKQYRSKESIEKKKARVDKWRKTVESKKHKT